MLGVDLVIVFCILGKLASPRGNPDTWGAKGRTEGRRRRMEVMSMILSKLQGGFGGSGSYGGVDGDQLTVRGWQFSLTRKTIKKQKVLFFIMRAMIYIQLKFG